MQCKPEVNLFIIPILAQAIPRIDQAHYDAGIARGAFITSAKDGAHMKGSKHKQDANVQTPGEALDLRTKDLTKSQVERLALALVLRLNGQKTQYPFQVFVEGSKKVTPHIHIEYDPT